MRAAGERSRPGAAAESRRSLLREIVRAARPHQWTKNILVFVPVITAQAFLEAAAWSATAILFASFCAVASSIYLVNDIYDVESDRAHPRKRKRPIASGALPIPVAWVASAVLMACGLGLGYAAGGVVVVLFYAVTSLAYSAFLKRFPIVDVFVLAGLYTLRVLGGALVSKHYATVWLLAFSGFTFLSLGLVKRVAELQESIGKDNRVNAARGYRSTDLGLLQSFGVAATVSSSVVLALFMNSANVFQNYRAPETLWLVVPLILLWQIRLWLATSRGNMHDDPIVYASRDWVTWLVFVTVLAVVLAASLGVGAFR